MREILFRGKDFSGVINHSWCIGSLDITEKEKPIIIYSDRFGNKCQIFVDAKTIGQYTGLTDMNGNKIFEGDILRYYDDEIQIVEWNKDFSNLMLHTYCKYERKKGRKVVIENADGWNWLHDYPLNKMSIIGNIYDNPELLKEAEQE